MTPYSRRALRRLLAWLTLAVPAAAATPVNLLLLFVDNVGYGDLGCYGHPQVRTPHLDRLAREGARCTQFYVVTSSCTPSRGALLTGRHPGRNGLSHQLAGTENWHGIGLPHRERILPELLRPAGYATGCFGKWNLGFAPGSRPTERGFDEFLGFRAGNIGYYDHLYNYERDTFRGTAPVVLEGYSTDLFADAAIDFIRRHADRPWFAYVPFNAAHFNTAQNVAPGRAPSWEVPAEYLAAYGWPADEPDPRRRYLAVLTALDAALGRMLGALDSLGLRERTLVAVLSDNGAFMLPGRGLEVASNAPLRSGGTTCYEGGIRVPALFRLPGRIPAGSTVTAMLSQLDLVPLALGLAGLTPPADRVLDGRDPLPALAGRAPSPHPRLGFAYAGATALREGPLKVVRPAPTAPWELYDVETDVAESRNLAGERPADVARLTAAHAAWVADLSRDASPRALWTPPSRKAR
jgi:arylsulfatase A-like enzyme